MAEKNHRLTENTPGAYYVTDDCIDCDMCRNLAPASFRFHEAIGLSIVFRQPETEEEFRAAEEAREDCPAEAIGNDG